jgi:tetratricopeptide (TPR) repeat protein
MTSLRARTFLLALAGLALEAAPLAAQKMKLLVPLESLIERARRDSLDAPAHYEVALGYWLDRKYDLAERHLREAIAIEPKTAAAYLALGYLPYARRPKLWDEVRENKVPPEWVAPVNEAHRFQAQAFIIDPWVDLKPLALMIPPVSSLGALKGGYREAFYTWFLNGLGSLWDGQYERAYKFFRDIAGNATEEQRQKDFSGWLLWYEALAAAHSNDFTRATANLRILMDRAEKEAEKHDHSAALAFRDANEYRYALGSFLHISGKSRDAIPLLQEVLSRDLGFYMAHTRLAMIYEDMHRPRSALEERRRAVAANPEDASLLYDLGVALAQAGELADAHGTLRQARAANPRHVRTLYILGRVEEQLGDTTAARETYRQFLAMAPTRFGEQKAEISTRLQALQ